MSPPIVDLYTARCSNEIPVSNGLEPRVLSLSTSKILRPDDQKSTNKSTFSMDRLFVDEHKEVARAQT